MHPDPAEASSRSRALLHHRVLSGGLVFIAVVFGVLLYAVTGPLAPGDIIAWTVASSSLIPILVGWGWVRGLIPIRPRELSAERYWDQAEVAGKSLLMWVLWEGAGILSLTGVLLTGHSAPVATGLVAMALLFFHGPAQLEARTH